MSLVELRDRYLQVFRLNVSSVHFGCSAQAYERIVTVVGEAFVAGASVPPSLLRESCTECGYPSPKHWPSCSKVS